MTDIEAQAEVASLRARLAAAEVALEALGLPPGAWDPVYPDEGAAALRQAAEVQRVDLERYRLIVENASEGIWAVDQNGRTTFVNPRVAEMLGYADPREMIGRDVIDFVRSEDRNELAKQLELRRLGQRSRRTAHILRKDGSNVLASIFASPIMGPDGAFAGTIALVTDITMEQQTEESFRQFMQASPDPAVVHRNGRILYMNPVATKALGFTDPEELTGRALIEFVAPEDREIMIRRVGEIAQRGHSPSIQQLRLLGKDGSTLLCEFTGMLVHFEGKQAIVSLGRDVTERRRLEARLMMTDRMASIGTLAAGVAHEINNPMAYVYSNIEYVARELAAWDDPEQGSPVKRELIEALHEAKEGTQRVRAIVRDLKSFSRTEGSERGPVDVHRVLDGAANMAFNEIRHRARLVKDYAGMLLVAEGNEGRLGQLFLNLLVNAAQAIPEGGGGPNEIRICTRMIGDRIAVEVRDTGTGIAPEVRDRLFDPFFTTKPVGVGTGLGLAICHSIVSDHAGEIQVESEVGRGTTFRVLLPAAQEAPNEAPPRVAPESTRVPRARLLVVDDEPLIGMVLNRSLKRNHDVVAVTSAKVALAKIESGEKFDLIICDLMMPEMSGMDFYERLSESHPDKATQMVFLSGGAFTQSARGFLERVPNARLEKPFEARTLLTIIEERLRQAAREPERR